jgi:hypothetical protein
METYTYADQELSPLPMKWVWTGYIPRYCMTEGYGEGGTMKGLSIQSIISLITLGADMPDGSANGFGGPRSVISITGEDLLRQGMAWRYRAAGADTRNIIDLSKDEDGRPFKLNDKGLARIRETICKINAHEDHPYDKMADYGVLYLDPMMSITPRNVSQNTTFRSVLLEPLDALCADEELGEGGTGCFLMNHSTKDKKVVAGSAAAVQGPRMVLGFRQSPRNPTHREVYRYKTNITENTPAPVPYMGEGKDTSLRVRWMTDSWEQRRRGSAPLSRYGSRAEAVLSPAPVPAPYAAPVQEPASVSQMWKTFQSSM